AQTAADPAPMGALVKSVEYPRQLLRVNTDTAICDFHAQFIFTAVSFWAFTNPSMQCDCVYFVFTEFNSVVNEILKNAHHLKPVYTDTSFSAHSGRLQST